MDLGLDISTSIVGIVLLDKAGKLRHMDHIKLTSTKFDNMWKKADEVERFLRNDLPFYKHLKINRIFVEENAKRFTTGYSSADTILTLAKFNGIVSYMAQKIFAGAAVFDINVASARKQVGLKIDRADKTKSVKEKVFEELLRIHPEFPWLTHVAKTGKSKGQEVYDVCNRDMSDAYVICRGGQALHA